MTLYTKTGDSGQTSLVGGERVSKAHARLEAYGTVDELMAHIGFLHDMLPVGSPVREQLVEILSRLMDCSALLASQDDTLAKLPQLTAESVSMLEKWTDEHTADLPPLKYFTLPVGLPLLSYTHICRTVCRRAERRVVSCAQENNVSPQVSMYINRLSDYFYALGRHLAHQNGVDDTKWKAH